MANFLLGGHLIQSTSSEKPGIPCVGPEMEIFINVKYNMLQMSQSQNISLDVIRDHDLFLVCYLLLFVPFGKKEMNRTTHLRLFTKKS